ncbi:MAG: DUF3368 domain-containing protein [Acidobacteriota bacterium]
MPAGPVVVDNTPLVALYVLGRLDLLGGLFGEVFIPSAVAEEFLATDAADRGAALERHPEILTRRLTDPRRALGYPGVDRGEAELLALAEEEDASLVVVDERKARRLARRLEFPLTGTLGLLLLAKEHGLLDRVSMAIDSLQAAGLFIHAELATRVVEMAGEGP